MTSPRAPILREYFGTARFGTIFGLTSIFITAGVVAAPPLAGWTYDVLGTYQPVWLGLCIATLAGTILMAATPPAKRSETITPEPTSGRSI